MSASRRHNRPQVDGGPEYALHLTPASNLASIGLHGLLPCIGPLAKLAGETAPQIYLYNSVADFSHELLQWMGNLLASPGDAGHTPIAMLAVDTTQTGTHAHRGDYVCSSAIDAGALDIITLDLNPGDDLEEMMDEFCERRFTAQMLGSHSEPSWRELALLARHGLMDEADAVRRTHRRARTGVAFRDDVAQTSLFPIARPIPRS